MFRPATPQASLPRNDDFALSGAEASPFADNDCGNDVVGDNIDVRRTQYLICDCDKEAPTRAPRGGFTTSGHNDDDDDDNNQITSVCVSSSPRQIVF
jgi:hypothetical protein